MIPTNSETGNSASCSNRPNGTILAQPNPCNHSDTDDLKLGSTLPEKHTNLKPVSNNPPEKTIEEIFSSHSKPWYRHPRADEIALGIEILPEDFPLTPVLGKKAFLPNWNKSATDRELILEYLLHGVRTEKRDNPGDFYPFHATGFGLLTGDKYLAVDVDGKSALDLFHLYFRLNEGAVLNTVCHTSGKPGRRTYIFQLSLEQQDMFADVKNKKIKLTGEDGTPEELDFRYKGTQCVLPPSHHPETGRYDWINSPQDTQVQELPKCVEAEICKLLFQERHQEALEKPLDLDDLAIPQQVKIEDVAKTETGYASNCTLSEWFREKQKGCDPKQLFNHSAHHWQGNKGYSVPGMFQYEPEQSVSIFEKNGIYALKDFGSGILYDAIRYEYVVNLGGRDYPKGKDYHKALKSLAERMEWGELSVSGYSLEKYLEAVKKEQNYLGGLREDGTVIRQKGKYLNTQSLLDVLPKDRGFILKLRSPMGGGKTVFAAEYLRTIERFTSLVPTTALGIDQSAKFGSTMRENVGIVGESKHDNACLREESKLTLCHPSLHRVHDRKGDVLVLDEAGQGLDFLYNGSPCNQSKLRAKNIAAFERLVQCHESIILMESGLNNIVCDYIEELRPDLEVFTVILEPEPKERNVYYCLDERWMENKITEMISHDKNIAVIHDSAEKLLAFETKFNQKNIKNFIICRDKVSEVESQLFLKDGTNYLANEKPQVFGYSPTLGAGFSIEETAEYKFDALFAFNSHLSADAFCQMPGRPRTNCDFYYWVGEVKNYPDNCSSALTEGQRRHMMERWNSNLIAQLLEEQKSREVGDFYSSVESLIISIEGTKVNAKQIDRQTKVAARLRARNAYMLNDRPSRIHKIFKDEGYSVKIILKKQELLSDNPTAEEAKEWEKYQQRLVQYKAEGYTIVYEDNEDAYSSDEKDQTKNARDTNRIEESRAVIAEPLIDEQTFKLLDSKQALTKQERHQKKRYQLEKRIPLILEKVETPEEFYLYHFIEDRGNILSGIDNFVNFKNLDKLRQCEAKNIDSANKRWSEAGISTYQDTGFLKFAAFKFLEENDFMKIFDFKGEETYSIKSLRENIDKLSKTKANTGKLKLHFGLDKLLPNSDNRSVRAWVEKLLNRFGHELKKSHIVKGTHFFKVTPIPLLSTPEQSENEEENAAKLELWQTKDKELRAYIEELSLQKLDERINGKTEEFKKIREIITKPKQTNQKQAEPIDDLGTKDGIKELLELDVRAVAKQFLQDDFSCENEELIEKANNLIELIRNNSSFNSYLKHHDSELFALNKEKASNNEASDFWKELNAENNYKEMVDEIFSGIEAE